MEIWELNKLILFIAFVVPGFISIKAYQILFPGAEKSASEQLIDAIAYSSINYALLFLPIAWIWNAYSTSSNQLCYYPLFVLTLFIAPVFWAFLWKKIRTMQFFQKNAPHPTAKPWDFVFSKRKSYWMKVTLKDGTKIAGLYSDKSFSSSAPAPEQIYLEESWILGENDQFERKKNATAGVIIISNEISHIELREYGENNE